jgi:hypothetical protein
VSKWLKSPEGVFSRFSIEDALMAGGFKPRKPVSASRHGLQLSEDHTPLHVEAAVPVTPDEAPLDKALRNFLHLVRKEWSEEEMQASIAFLKDVFRKLGKN